jgi:hypothetical protein
MRLDAGLSPESRSFVLSRIQRLPNPNQKANAGELRILGHDKLEAWGRIADRSRRFYYGLSTYSQRPF